MDETQTLLQQWDDSLSPAQQTQLDHGLARRQFLQQTAKAGTGLLLLPTLSLFSACDNVAPTTEPWLTFSAVLQILFPADGNGPSARDLNATAYLQFVLEADDTEQETRDFIVQGIDWLNQLSHKTQQTMFVQCTTAQQETLIGQIAKSSSGERWLSFLLLYLFEALLSDPAYGANPNGVGWQWLEHQAGFPSPPTDKLYPELLKR